METPDINQTYDTVLGMIIWKQISLCSAELASECFLFVKGYKFWYNGMSDFRALLAFIAVARTIIGRIFPFTIAPSNNGPKNGTWIQKVEKFSH